MGRRLALLLAAAVTIALALAGAAQAATLSGTVTTQRGGEPLVGVSGARIEVYDAAGDLVASRWTDSEGNYGLPTPDGTHRVDVVADGYETKRRDGVELSGSGNRLDVTLTPVGEARLHGTLHDGAGRALEGVSLLLWAIDPFVFVSTTVAADGSFSLTAPTGAYTFQFGSGDSSLSWSFAGSLTLTGDREVALGMPQIVSASVRALDDDDRAVADAPVYYHAVDVPRTIGGIAGRTALFDNAVTGADGRATFRTFRGDQGAARLTVSPALPGYADSDLEPSYLRGGEQFDLHLVHAAQLRLSVRDGVGAPVTDASVAIDDRWAALGGDPVVVDAPEGRRTVTSIHSDRTTVWEFRSSQFGLFGTQERTLSVPASEQRLVRVVDGDGEPVADATVAPPWQRADAFAAGDFTGTLRATGSPSTTDRAGETTVSSFAGAQTDPDGRGTVTPPAGSELPEVRFALADRGTTTVVLEQAPRTVHVSGEIWRDGRPLGGITVGGTGAGSRAVTDVDGRFDVDVDPAEEFSVSWARSEDRYVAELDLSEDRQVRLTLPWQTSWPVARVVDRAAAPVVGATVELPALTTTFDWGDGIVGRAIEHRTTTVGRDGRAWVQLSYGNGQWSGDGAIAVTPPAGSGLPSARAAFDGTAKTFVLDDEPGLVLFDGFLAVDGPLADVPLRLGRATSTTDQSGDFAFVVAAGRHDLHGAWQASDGAAWTLAGAIDLSESRNENFRTGSSPVTVHVRDEEGRPVAGATVALPVHTSHDEFRWFAPDVTLSAAPAPIVTDADGDAVVRVPWRSVPQGEAMVTAPGGGATQSFRLDDDGETTVTLAPETAVVSGVVLEADGSLSTRVLRVLIDGAGISTSRPASFTRTVPLGEHQLRVNGDGFALEGAFTVTGDRTLTVRLPPAVSLSVRALGSGGRGVADVAVWTPFTSVTGSFGDLGGGTLTAYPADATTDAGGLAVVSLFAGAAAEAGRTGHLSPPTGSGYEFSQFSLPPLDRDASIDVQLAGGPVDAGPQIDLAVAPEPLVRGDWWSVSRVAVQVTASDDDGVASLACSVDGVARTFTQTRTATTRSGTFYVNTEGRHTAACTALDGAGRTASRERAVNLDLKNPAAPTASPDRPADNVVYGWWRDSVTVSFGDNGDPPLADGSAGSGVDPGSVPAPVTYDRSGTFTASGTVTDRAGRVSSAGRATVKVDADAPTSTLTCPANPVTLGAGASARWQDADGQSGLPNGSAGTVALDTSSIGSFAAWHTAVDRVGHETVSSCRYQVVYAFAWRGNLQAAPALNAVAPGVSTQTVWFSIGGDQGANPIESGWPRVEPVDCATGAPSGRAITATATGPLTWDAANGRYGIAWAVARDLPSGRCAALRLRLDDGVEREVLFAR